MRLGVILVPLGAVGLVGVLFGFSDGLPDRLGPTMIQLTSAAENFDPRREDCLLRERGGAVGPCLYGAANAEPSFAVLGDSQAAALAPGIAKVAMGSGQAFRLFAMAGCRPALGYKSPGNSCDWHTHAAVTAILADQRLKVVVIAAEYANTIYNGLGGSQLHPEAEPSLVADLPVLFPNTLAAHQTLFAARFADIVGQLAQSGRQIILVEPIPDVTVDVPRALARLAARDADWGDFAWPRSYYDRRQAFVLSLFEELAQSDPAITLAQPQDRLCDRISCRLSWQGNPLYIDSYHLSLVGADLAATAITPDMLVPR